MNTTLNVNQKESKNLPELLPFVIYPLTGQEQQQQEVPATPQRNQCFQITWITKGAGSYLLDLIQYPIQDNTVFCVAPGQIQQFTPGLGTKGFVISFKESFLFEGDNEFNFSGEFQLFDIFFQCNNLQVDQEIALELQDLALKMSKEYGNYFSLKNEMLRRYLKIFLIHLSRQMSMGENNPGQVRNIILAKKFMSLLEKNFKEKKKVTEYADALSITPNYLNVIVKKAFGYPASHFIKQRVILEAKRKALYSDSNMKEIAYHLGFDDIAHFSKFFKNTSGMNFTNFKNASGITNSRLAKEFAFTRTL